VVFFVVLRFSFEIPFFFSVFLGDGFGKDYLIALLFEFLAFGF